MLYNIGAIVGISRALFASAQKQKGAKKKEKEKEE
jgi:hypothetical protein